jgi:hypothetical protein
LRGRRAALARVRRHDGEWKAIAAGPLLRRSRREAGNENRKKNKAIQVVSHDLHPVLQVRPAIP